MAHRGPPAGSASPSFSPFNNNSPIPPPPPHHQLHHHHQQQQHLQYARSPVALGSPLSPYPAGPSPVGQQAAASPPMALRGPSGRVVEYNPQQWGQGGPTGVAISHAALAGAGAAPRDPDVELNPPPPYSPPPPPGTVHRNASAQPPPASAARPQLPFLQTSFSAQRGPDYGSPMSAMTLVTPLSTLDPNLPNFRSNMSPMTPRNGVVNFPPPPGRDTSASRAKAEVPRSRFGLSALRGKSSDRSAPQPELQPGQELPQPVQPMTSTSYSLGHRVPNRAAQRASVHITPTEPLFDPPTARRSASAGPSPQTVQMPPANWAPGMPLPPPPPGPPPPARSASADPTRISVGNTTVPVLSMPTRRAPLRDSVTRMETIPHTPAWFTDSQSNDGPPPPVPPVPPVPPLKESLNRRGSFEEDSSGIVRTERLSRAEYPVVELHDAPKRDTTVKGIRERRSESRAARERNSLELEDDSSQEAKPADLVLNVGAPGITRQGAVKKRSSMSPKAPPDKYRVSSRKSSLTSPLPSPYAPKNPAFPDAGASSARHGKAPSQTFKERAPSATRDGKRVSGQSWGSRPGSSAGDDRSNAAESFERYQTFAEKERIASSDRERLHLFAEYIVMESRIRRNKYAEAFNSITASDILDLTRDLWRPLPAKQSRPRRSVEMGMFSPRIGPNSFRTNSFGSQDTGSPASSRNWTPQTEEDSPASSTGGAATRDGAVRQYQPVLSPILSMAVSTNVDDEQNSRGRSTSRWWESESGSLGAAGKRLPLSKQESKYMGLHPDARFNLQYDDEPSPAAAHGAQQAPPVGGSAAGEYPPEKVGWHDDDAGPVAPVPLSGTSASTIGAPLGSATSYAATTGTPLHVPPSLPPTPSATAGLDVSRLVTLPPPYPRHYPATSNAHPQLAPARATLRALADLPAEASAARRAFAARTARARAVAVQEAAVRAAARPGEAAAAGGGANGEPSPTGMSAAEAEAAALRAHFEAYGPEVATPMRAALMERIARANASIESLRAALRESDREAGPDAPMEEGDERPELLERLKLIKWLVEGREGLYREVFALESERCERYRELMMCEMRAKGEGEGRVRSAEAFFKKDLLERWNGYECDARERTEELFGLIERLVGRGVQDQSSAFWDIVPGLLEVLRRVPARPEDVAVLAVSVPHKELDDNAAYRVHPLQYLYGLLRHADKATYQFIENQVGLWCLHHEVATLVMRAGLRVVRADRCREQLKDADDAEVGREMADLGGVEEQRLNGELKERVEELEAQWEEAFGQEIAVRCEVVESVLRGTGGWEEGLKA